MSQKIQSKIKDKIQEDISPTRNLSGVHLKIVFGIAILWTLFQLWYASPFPFWLNFGMFKGLPARALAGKPLNIPKFNQKGNGEAYQS